MTTGSAQPSQTPLCVCVVGLGGGGFHWEAQKIIQAVRRPLELVLVYGGPNGGIMYWHSEDAIRAKYVVRGPSLTGDGALRKSVLTAGNIVQALRILYREKPDVVLAVGTAQAVPFAIAARLANYPLWFAESVTRVQAPSRTGCLIARLRLASKLFYYSPELAPHYPDGVCIERGAT